MPESTAAQRRRVRLLVGRRAIALTLVAAGVAFGAGALIGLVIRNANSSVFQGRIPEPGVITAGTVLGSVVLFVGAAACMLAVVRAKPASAGNGRGNAHGIEPPAIGAESRPWSAVEGQDEAA